MGMSHRVKVLMANRPQAARAFLEVLFQEQDDIQVVGVVLDPIELLISIEDVEADVVVITLPESGGIPGICSHLLYQYPALLILALSADCQELWIYRQVIESTPLDGGTSDNILAAIRRFKAEHEG